MRKIKYTHYSASNYITDRPYDLEEVKKDLPIETIKCKFTPVNFKWEDLDNEVLKVTNVVNEEVKAKGNQIKKNKK